MTSRNAKPARMAQANEAANTFYRLTTEEDKEHGVTAGACGNCLNADGDYRLGLWNADAEYHQCPTHWGTVYGYSHQYLED